MNNNSPPKPVEEGEECQICPRKDVYHFNYWKVEVVLGSGIMANIKCCDDCDKKIKRAEGIFEEKKKTEERKSGKKSKAERRAETMEISHEWARNINGKQVWIYWEVNNALIFATSDSENKARGVAYTAGKSACGGWGQVKIILDSRENERVKVVCHETGLCGVVKQNMYFAPDRLLCDKTDCKEQVRTVDGRRWGLQVKPTDDGNWWLMVTYGERKALEIIDEEEKQT